MGVEEGFQWLTMNRNGCDSQFMERRSFFKKLLAGVCALPVLSKLMAKEETYLKIPSTADMAMDEYEKYGMHPPWFNGERWHEWKDGDYVPMEFHKINVSAQADFGCAFFYYGPDKPV